MTKNNICFSGSPVLFRNKCYLKNYENDCDKHYVRMKNFESCNLKKLCILQCQVKGLNQIFIVFPTSRKNLSEKLCSLLKHYKRSRQRITCPFSARIIFKNHSHVSLYYIIPFLSEFLYQHPPFLTKFKVLCLILHSIFSDNVILLPRKGIHEIIKPDLHISNLRDVVKMGFEIYSATGISQRV